MNFQEPIGGLVERIARALERLAPPSPRKPDFDKTEAFIWQAEPEAFLPVGNVNRVPLVAAQGHRPHARRALRQHCPLRARPSRQQRAPMGRPRHRQELPRQGGACGSQPRGEVASGRAEARRDPPRGHWLAATMSCASPRHQGQALHPVLRRPVLRGARHLLQIAESGARRRHRRAARARVVLRDLEPAASHAA